jgi:hypothetical protein
MELKDIVMKLVGPVSPIGETNEDNQRYENLKVLCDLTDDLIAAIDKVAYQNKDRAEYSMMRAGQLAHNTINDRFGIKD